MFFKFAWYIFALCQDLGMVFPNLAIPIKRKLQAAPCPTPAGDIRDRDYTLRYK